MGVTRDPLTESANGCVTGSAPNETGVTDGYVNAGGRVRSNVKIRAKSVLICCSECCTTSELSSPAECLLKTVGTAALGCRLPNLTSLLLTLPLTMSP